MKRFFLFLAALALGLCATAQTQQGYVKTKGRMIDGKLVPGQGLKGALVSVKGRTSILVNTDDGAFSFPVTETQFHLDSVKKKGYQLVDLDACPKTYKYSSNPLYIVMETPDQQLQDKLNAERKIRRNLQKQLQAKEDEIEVLKAENKISLEEYHQALQRIYDEQESNEQLISDMAQRYSEIDYDQLDEFYRQVSCCIENGELVKADSLLRSRGDIKAQVNTILQRGQALQEEKEKLHQAEAVQQADIDEAAKRCYSFYETFLVQHLNDSAVYYLELRAKMDTTNLAWQLEAGAFLDNYLADYDKAMSYYKKASDYAISHPEGNLEHQVTSLNNIGYLLSSLNDFTKAKQYYDQALMIAQKNFGETHKLTADVYNNLGFHYIDMGEFSKALEYIKKSSEILEVVLDPEDPIVATSYNNIGHVLAEIGETDSAMVYYTRSLAMREKALGTYHPLVATSYNNLGFCYVHRLDYPNAMWNFKKALEIDSIVLGPKHPDIALLYNNLGFLYAGQGDYKQGLDYYTKALKIRLEVFGEENENSAISYDNIGNVYSKMGEYELALENTLKALSIKKKLFGPDHASLGTTYFNIGFIYAKQGNYTKALEYYNISYNILKDSFGEDHHNTKYAAKSIEQIKEKIKEQEHE